MLEFCLQAKATLSLVVRDTNRFGLSESHFPVARSQDIPDEETQACEQMICQLDDEAGRAEAGQTCRARHPEEWWLAFGDGSRMSRDGSNQQKPRRERFQARLSLK